MGESAASAKKQYAGILTGSNDVVFLKKINTDIVPCTP